MKWTRYERNYESEFSRFLNDYKRKHPAIEQQQRAGRLLYWDKPPLSPDELKRLTAPEVKMKPYVYV
jgi:hypothetical protein